MAREIYSLEAGILESQHLKSIANLLRGPPALRRVAHIALNEVKEESEREVDPMAPRAARQLLLFHQSQLVGRLRNEHETVLMMMKAAPTSRKAAEKQPKSKAAPTNIDGEGVKQRILWFYYY